MSKKKSKKDVITTYDIRARVTAEAERDQAIKDRDRAIAAAAAAMTAPGAAGTPAAPPPPPDLAPVEVSRREYEILKSADPYRAAEFLLQNPEIAYSRFGT